MAEQYPTALKVEKRKQVEARTGLSRSTIYQLVGEGAFPAPISLSAHSVGWLSHEVDEWIAERIRLREAGKDSARRLMHRGKAIPPDTNAVSAGEVHQ
jgi:prophage regulatory protein